VGAPGASIGLLGLARRAQEFSIHTPPRKVCGICRTVLEETKMGFFSFLLGKEAKDADDRGMSRLQATTRDRTRRELISTAVWDTIRKHGLPVGCITADALPSYTSTRHRGIHLQLVYRNWRPDLLSYVVAVEAAVKNSLERLDPFSSSWITGVSWRFEPEDSTAWPELPVSRKTRSRSGAPSPDRQQAPANPGLGAGHARFPAYTQRAAAPDFDPTVPMSA
jgi:hypothetical protein